MSRASSIYLDLVRFLAATTVFLIHAQYDRFTGGLPFARPLANLGNDAVMVFFVLSGFVIAYVADKKEKTVKDYALSRLARLYSVTAPALVLTVLADYFGSRIDYAAYTGWDFRTDHPFWRLFANFFFVNELWFYSVRPFSNGPFWSLGYEFWYYVIFAAAFYFKAPDRYWLVLLISIVVGPKIMILFPIWLLGVGVYHLTTTRKIGEGLGWALVLGSAASYLAFRIAGWPERLLDWMVENFGAPFVHGWLGQSKYFLSSYVIGPLVALHFVGISAIAHRLGKIMQSIEVPVRYLAGYTFAIYLLHFPLLQFFAVLCGGVAHPELRRAFVLIGVVITIWAVGSVTEARRTDLKKVLSSLFDAIVRKASLMGRGSR